MVGLAAEESVADACRQYLNRLSDLLFVQARAANQAAGVADVPWLGRNAPRA